MYKSYCRLTDLIPWLHLLRATICNIEKFCFIVMSLLFQIISSLMSEFSIGTISRISCHAYNSLVKWWTISGGYKLRVIITTEDKFFSNTF